mgnify:FL=1
MAHYLVKARPTGDMKELKRRLDGGAVRSMRPFGEALDHSLRNARVDSEGRAVWEELDYCSPPLTQERAAVLDDYFSELETQEVEKGEGWERIANLPRLF